MNISSDAPRRERIEAVLALAAARLPSNRRDALEAFARSWFRQVDTDDLLERSPEDLCGALLSHWQWGTDAQARAGQGAGAEPGDRRGRLGLAPLGGRDRQRRHAVPGRLDHRRGEPPGADAAPHRASGAGGRAQHRRRTAIGAVAQRRAGRGAARIVDAHRGRPSGRGLAARRSGGRHRARAGRRACGGRGLEADAGQAGRRGRRAGRRPEGAARRRGRRDAGIPAMAARRPLHAARLPRARPRRQRRRRHPAAGARQRPGRAARRQRRPGLGQLRRADRRRCARWRTRRCRCWW